MGDFEDVEDACLECSYREREGAGDSSYCHHPEIPGGKEDIDLWGQSVAPFWCPRLSETNKRRGADTSEPGEQYLGDGLYISFDGFQARVFTYNGIESTDQVFVDPDVAKTLIHWLKKYMGETI